MAIVVVKDGAIKPVLRIYRKQGTTWKECLQVDYIKSVPGGPPELVVVFDRYLLPPTGVRGVSATYNSGQLAWDASPLASGYQVLRRPYATSGGGVDLSSTPTIFPSPTTWTSELSLNNVGLAQNTRYTYTVRARRILSDGSELVSPESSPITLYTGYPPVTKHNPEWPGQRLVYINPTGSASWTNAYGWGANSGSPDVVQGYLQYSNRNAKGCVIYSNAFVNMRDSVQAADPNYLYYAGWESIVFNSAVIERVHRGNGPTQNTPEVRIRATNTQLNGAEPPLIGDYDTFQAPLPQADKYDIGLPHLLGWVSYWCLHPIPGSPGFTNGMVVFRTDGQGNATAGYNGFTTLREAGYLGNCWRIKLYISWTYTIPGQSPAWSTTSA